MGAFDTELQKYDIIRNKLDRVKNNYEGFVAEQNEALKKAIEPLAKGLAESLDSVASKEGLGIEFIVGCINRANDTFDKKLENGFSFDNPTKVSFARVDNANDTIYIVPLFDRESHDKRPVYNFALNYKKINDECGNFSYSGDALNLSGNDLERLNMYANTDGKTGTQYLHDLVANAVDKIYEFVRDGLMIRNEQNQDFINEWNENYANAKVEPDNDSIDNDEDDLEH